MRVVLEGKTKNKKQKINYVTKKKKNKQTNKQKNKTKQKINYVTIQNKLEKYI